MVVTFIILKLPDRRDKMKVFRNLSKFCTDCYRYTDITFHLTVFVPALALFGKVRFVWQDVMSKQSRYTEQFKVKTLGIYYEVTFFLEKLHYHPRR